MGGEDDILAGASNTDENPITPIHPSAGMERHMHLSKV